MSTTVNLFKTATDGRDYAAGEVIFSKGDPGEVMYVVQSGEVEIVLGDAVIDRHGPGAVFGEMALIDAGPRSATAVAATDCRIVPVNQQRFEFLVQQTPHFATTVMRIMVERLRRRMAALAADL
jgi:CRP/FNR family cyclic AMP-dependent transcriptional regulator